jgi:glycosyltransferase involved in cell wall biosynthesis
MLKAADALAGAGYRVRVVSARQTDWATVADAAVAAGRPGAWRWTVVDHGRAGAPGRRLWTGMRTRVAQALAGGWPGRAVPIGLAVRAYARIHTELCRAARAEPADLYYGGTTGALAAVARAGRRSGAPYALDLEDFHSAEQDDTPATRLAHRLAERIERAILPGAAFLTTSSAAIGRAYTRAHGVMPTVIHNAFPLPTEQPDLRPVPGEALRLYWFGQTIGPRRGLEDAVRAVGVAGIGGELHVRGRAMALHFAALVSLAADVAPRLKVIHHEPAPPDEMVALCRGHDIGLALEPGFSPNNRAALSNKALTYALAGLAVALTDTDGQRPFARDLGAGALTVTPGDVEGLARGLRAWADDRARLHGARVAAWDAARRRWHWEHPSERGELLAAVARVLA